MPVLMSFCPSWAGHTTVDAFRSVLTKKGNLKETTKIVNDLGQKVKVKFYADAAVRDANPLTLLDVTKVTEEQLQRSGLKEINPVGLLNLNGVNFEAVRSDVEKEVSAKAVELLPENCPQLYFELKEAMAAGAYPSLDERFASLDPDT